MRFSRTDITHMSHLCPEVRDFRIGLGNTRDMADNETATGPTCPSCSFPTRVVDHWWDYSTTRGPMTSYEVTYCDQCKLSSLNRRSAQETRAIA